jgi:hypothetical protein
MSREGLKGGDGVQGAQVHPEQRALAGITTDEDNMTIGELREWTKDLDPSMMVCVHVYIHSDDDLVVPVDDEPGMDVVEDTQCFVLQPSEWPR